ncbi:MAG: hypothetical protein ACR2MQ_13715 [Gemmatimonadaceae bacterium]
MRRSTFPVLFAAALIALPAISAGAQSATRHTSSSARSHAVHSKSTAKKPTSKSTAKSTSKASTLGMTGAWQSVYSDNEVALSMDTLKTNRLQDGSFSTRLKWQYATDKSIGRNETYRTLVETRLMNCTLFGSKPVSAQTYNVSGKPVSSFTSAERDLKYMDWGVRKGGTSSSKAYAALCGSLKH